MKRLYVDTCMCTLSGDDVRVSKKLFKQILQAVQYIHSKNLLHRDLKVDTFSLLM